MSQPHTVQLPPNGLVSLVHTPDHLLPMSRHNANTRLLSLPAELRDHIFTYILGGNTIDPRSHTVRSAFGTLRTPSIAFALVRVCRQTYVEAAPMICALNTLVISYASCGTWTTSQLSGSHTRMAAGEKDAVRAVKIEQKQVLLWFYGLGTGCVGDMFPNAERLVLNRRQIEDVLGYWFVTAGCGTAVDLVKMHERKGLEIVLE